MRQKFIPVCAALLFAISLVPPAAAQSLEQILSPDLDRVGKGLVEHFRRTRPEWKHETIPPATPPNVRPGPYTAIHIWSAERCLTAEIIVDGVRSGPQPIPCRIKLVITESQSAVENRMNLTDFVVGQHGARPAEPPIGDKGYVWSATSAAFVKGRFIFWLEGRIDLRAGDFAYNREFIEKLAREIADAVNAA